ncbi:MAG: hypothetical protein ACJAQT_004547 [Akkermansiaceae bacterium]|jgi:hypothetical protein
MNVMVDSNVSLKCFSVYVDGEKISTGDENVTSFSFLIPDDASVVWFKVSGIGRSKKVALDSMGGEIEPRIKLWKLSNFQALFVMVMFSVIAAEFWPIIPLAGKVLLVVALFVISGLLGNIFVIRLINQN